MTKSGNIFFKKDKKFKFEDNLESTLYEVYFKENTVEVLEQSYYDDTKSSFCWHCCDYFTVEGNEITLSYGDRQQCVYPRFIDIKKRLTPEDKEVLKRIDRNYLSISTKEVIKLIDLLYYIFDDEMEVEGISSLLDVEEKEVIS